MDVLTLEAGFAEPNAGGIRRLLLVEATPRLTLLDPARFPIQGGGVGYPGIAANNVLIEEGTPIVEWKLLPNAAEFTISHQYSTANGQRTDCTISWDVPATSLIILKWLAEHGGRRWVAFLEDGNGQGYVMGEPTNGMRLWSSQASGKKRPDGGKRTFVLSCSMAHPAWLLDDFDLITTYRPEFDLSFDSSFTS